MRNGGEEEVRAGDRVQARRPEDQPEGEGSGEQEPVPPLLQGSADGGDRPPGRGAGRRRLGEEGPGVRAHLLGRDRAEAFAAGGRGGRGSADPATGHRAAHRRPRAGYDRGRGPGRRSPGVTPRGRWTISPALSPGLSGGSFPRLVLNIGTPSPGPAPPPPLRGFRPARAPRRLVVNTPKPRSSTRSPCVSASAIVSRIALTRSSTSCRYRWGFCSASFSISSDLSIGSLGRSS